MTLGVDRVVARGDSAGRQGTRNQSREWSSDWWGVSSGAKAQPPRAPNVGAEAPTPRTICEMEGRFHREKRAMVKSSSREKRAMAKSFSRSERRPSQSSLRASVCLEWRGLEVCRGETTAQEDSRIAGEGAEVECA